MNNNDEIYIRLERLHKKIFGYGASGYQILKSHGSERRIIRLKSKDNSVIGIINQKTEENRTFISFARHFKKYGIKVPKIYGESEDGISYIIEDLGDETLFEKITKTGIINEEINEIYKKVIIELPRFQIIAGKDIDYSICYQFREFGEENIEYDINYFKERFLKVYYEADELELTLTKELNSFKYKAIELPIKYFLYRDFQSRNIMLKEDEIYFIDFQSGRKGALLYDISSLLYDAKAKIPQNLREDLLEYYINILNSYKIDNLVVYKEYFWYFSVLRILQALGAYGYLGYIKGKEEFLESIPYALENLIFILENRLESKNYSTLIKITNEILKKYNNR